MAHTAHDTDTHHGHDHAAHPTEKQYWMVFVLLVALTAVEVAWSFLGAEGPALVIPLLVMMTVKFFLVAGAFMHLYFDLKILNGRLFTWAFFGAILLAGAVYAAVIASFRFNI
ncbi:MAG: cytochrome C oxidase subunit IV family protein [Acidimicrobiia bacterium]|nr:cytochrome C oxidase subunit IV family protein [Acidimicrobiia bacterium]